MAFIMEYLNVFLEKKVLYEDKTQDKNTFNPNNFAESFVNITV